MVKMELCCCEKFICITYRNNIKPCWRLLLLKLFSFKQHRKNKKHERLCNDHDYRYVEMSNEYNKILKYNHGEKSLNAPAIIYADLECLLEKMHSCQNNPEKSYTEKKLSIRLLIIRLQIVHLIQIVNLIQQKISLTVTKVKTVRKVFVNTSESMQ